MARIRTVKPEFWEDEKIASLSMPCRLFFIGTWNFADDIGVFRSNPAILKSRIFPYDDDLRVSEVKKWLDALEKARMIIPIIHNGESYYKIRTFQSHQKIDKRYGTPLIDECTVNQLISEAENAHADNTAGTQCGHSVYTPQEKEEERKGVGKGNDESFDSPSVLDFDNVWILYGKKGNKKTSKLRWGNLSGKKKKLALEHIPKYVASTPEIKYRKHFETYINQESWNDELFTEKTGMDTNNRGNGGNSYRSNAEKHRAERQSLVELSEAILQHPRSD